MSARRGAGGARPGATSNRQRSTPSTLGHEVVCFLCQQAAEKALKGFLVAQGEEVVWGHSVADLCERAGRLDASFEALRSMGAALDVFYVPTRYPNGLPGGLPADAFGPDDAERGLERAGAIIEAVKRGFGD